MKEEIRDQLRELNAKINAYINAQRLTEALAAATKAMSLVDENTIPAKEPGIYAMQLQQLGYIYLHTHQIDKAEEAANQCLRIREEHFGASHPVIGTTLHLLAAIVSQKEGNTKARETLQKAIDIWRLSFPDDHPFIVNAQKDLNQLNQPYKPDTEALQAYNAALKKIKDANYKEAEILLQQAISINREKLGFDHPDVISCLNAYGNLLKETGRLEEAESTFKEALYMARKQKKIRNFHPYAVVLSEYANLVKGRDRLIEAKQMFEELFTLDHHFDRRELNKIRNNYASLISLLGDNKKALEMLDNIIAETSSDIELIDDFAAIPLANKASILSDAGNVKEALVLYKNALAVKEGIYGTRHPSYARTLINIATLHSNTGNHTESYEILEQARQIFLQHFGENHPEHIRCLLMIAHLSKSNKNKKRTKELYQSAQAILLRNDPDNRLILLEIEKNLARLNGDKSALIASLRKQLWEYGKAHGEQSLSVIDAKSALASNLLIKAIDNKIGVSEPIFTEMEQLFMEAIQALEKKLKKDEMLSECQASLAIMYKYKGDNEKSYENIRLALLTVKENLKQVFSITSEKIRQQHAENTGFYLNVYLSILVSLPPDVFNKYRSEAMSFIISLKNIVADVIAGEYSIIQSSVLPEHRQIFERIYELRSMIAARMVEEYSIMSKDEDELEQWVREKEKLEASTALNLSYNNIIDSLMNVTLNDIQANLTANEAVIDLIAFKDYAFKWGGDSTIPDQYLVCLIQKNGSPQLIRLQDIDQLNATVKNFTEHISTCEVELTTSNPVADVLGKRLRNRLIDPLMPYLEGITSLRICPDSIFWNFPFEAIPLENKSYLIDRFNVSYLSSTRDMVKRSENAVAGKNLVIADPDFDYSDPNYPRIDEQVAEQLTEQLTENNLHLFGTQISYDKESPHLAKLDLYGHLAGTRKEGELVAGLLHATSLFGKEALEKKVKDINRPGILHIATHGFFWEHASEWSSINAKRVMASQTYNMGEMHLLMRSFSENISESLDKFFDDEQSEEREERENWYKEERSNPMICSGLVLAGVNTWLKRGSLCPEAQDCHLLAEDILGIDLLGTQLVTLSACDSARGIAQSHAGIFGMRRAFVLAGAGTLVMSLWKVPDKQTQEFMQHFYEAILSGKPCATALHDTRQWIRKQYSLPFYWAAFILQGKTGTISINN